LPASDPGAEEHNRSFQEACRLKNNLLRYQMEDTKRTRVIDDSCDWYDLVNNPWHSKDEREEAKYRAQRRQDDELKAKRMVCVDIDSSGQVTDGTSQAVSNRAQKDRSDLQEFMDRRR